MANAEGGIIHLGVTETGARPGLDAGTVTQLDPARVQNLVDSFIDPDSIRIDVSSEPADDPDRRVILISVAASGTYPFVFTKPGDYPDANGTSQCVFAKHAVYRRRGTKAEPAHREDFRRWIDQAAVRENESWKTRVAVLQYLPPGATVEMVTSDDEALDEPSALLRRATRMFRRNPNKLLTPQELAEVFLVRRELAFGGDELDLLIHSALRKRSTLFFWLDIANPTEELTYRLLDEAIGGSDRDKSDAGSSIATLAAIYLSDNRFQTVIDRLSHSSYAHFREAAVKMPSREAALGKLVAGRDRNLDGTPLRDWTEPDLASAADETARPMLTSTGNTQARTRRLSRIGIEVFLRHHRPDLLV